MGNIMNHDIKKMLNTYLSSVTELEQKIAVINELKTLLHQHSPFSTQPVDCVIWVKTEEVQGNDYNPNHMDTLEKKLLQRSLIKNGFTQPIVACHQDEGDIVVDGFHRYLLCQTDTVLQERLKGYIPVSRIGEGKEQDQQERIAATIRHNRARGKHLVTAMSDIVRDLHRLGWRDKRIGEELGMDMDEVLRLKQISGLTELFEGEEFSRAWTVE